MPERSDATPAIINEITTPGPASRLAMSPATTYMPVPLHEPTPSETKSRVVNNFLRDNLSNGIAVNQNSYTVKSGNGKPQNSKLSWNLVLQKSKWWSFVYENSERIWKNGPKFGIYYFRTQL